MFKSILLILLLTTACRADYRLYNSRGAYAGRWNQTRYGYRSYDSYGRYSGEMRGGPNYRMYDRSGRYSGTAKFNG